MLYPGVTLEGMLDGFRGQYLEKKGWVRSVNERSSVDHDGPVPWITYPALEFLKRAVRPEWRVFEYGSGNSTVWWSHRVSEIVSVDHDAAWHERLVALTGRNCELRHCPTDLPPSAETEAILSRYFEEVTEPPPPDDPVFRFNAGLLSRPFRSYAGELLRFAQSYFDVVVIDGMARSLSTWVAVRHAAPKAFLLFDNSDRPQYAPAYRLLAEAGYHRIDFWGPGPINTYEWCTSVFVRHLAALP